MKKGALLILTICLVVVGIAQTVFKTDVTQAPVIAGNPFQVQYILEDADEEGEFFQPDFKSLQVVNGPYIHTGAVFGPGGSRKIRNVVYTLVAAKPGKYIIPGASARINGKVIKSGNALLVVLSKAEAFNMGLQVDVPESNQDYFLGPGEDPYEKMRRNLFIKVSVDKKNCYVGEPVTAVFKLYSRLESKSDIVKNPGFYGFTVQDMVGLNDRMITTETINGKKFDVHTVRKVQLYPLQAGSFTVDPMEVANKVEFSKSAVNRKTEQQVDEGIFSEDDLPRRINTEVYENSMSTEPITVTVKPLPSKNQPETFSGATGKFSILASVDKNTLSKNEEGLLTVTIRGKGNFTQLSAPVIEWPEGIEGFEPSMKDSLDNTHAPINGSRVFHFRFVSAKSGNYILPGINFSFFDPDSNSYKTVSTHDTSLVIGKNEKQAGSVTTANKTDQPAKDRRGWWLAIILVVVSVGLAVTSWVRTQLAPAKPVQVTKPEPVKHSSPEDLLTRAYTALQSDDKKFYAILRNCVWYFFAVRLGLTGSMMNKSHLKEAMDQKKLSSALQSDVLDILSACEAGIFTSADTAEDKTALLEKTKYTLEAIEGAIS